MENQKLEKALYDLLEKNKATNYCNIYKTDLSKYRSMDLKAQSAVFASYYQNANSHVEGSLTSEANRRLSVEALIQSLLLHGVLQSGMFFPAISYITARTYQLYQRTEALEASQRFTELANLELINESRNILNSQKDEHLSIITAAVNEVIAREFNTNVQAKIEELFQKSFKAHHTPKDKPPEEKKIYPKVRKWVKNLVKKKRSFKKDPLNTRQRLTVFIPRHMTVTIAVLIQSPVTVFRKIIII